MMTTSDSSSLEGLPSMERSTQRPKLLEEFALKLIAVAHVVFKRARKLPCPLGKTVEYVEDYLAPWFEPVVGNIEERGLHLLSLADNEIHTVSDIAVAYIPFASMVVPWIHGVLSGQAVETMVIGLDKVRKRGVVGFTADVWVEYEPIVKSKSQSIYEKVHGVPGLSLICFILYVISAPLVSMISGWLFTHSVIKDKDRILCAEDDFACPPIVPTFTVNNETEGAQDASESESADVKRRNDHSQPTSVTADYELSKSGEVTEGSTTENAPVLVNYDKEDAAGTDIGKGKAPDLSVGDENEEDHDVLMDLFDTWGLGVKAISPRVLDTVRSHSLKDRPTASGSNGTSPSKPVSKSFRL